MAVADREFMTRSDVREYLTAMGLPRNSVRTLIEKRAIKPIYLPLRKYAMYSREQILRDVIRQPMK